MAGEESPAAGAPVACPACGGAATRSFYECTDVPVHSCLLVDSRREAVEFPQGDIELAVCESCGFVFNTRFDSARIGYSPDYEETQGFSPVFQHFIADLAGQWTDRYQLAGETVVEIGCGKGEFLTEMIRAGAGHGIGIDPGVHPERIATDVQDRTSWIRGFFPGDYPELTARAVICRHTLEHIAPVGEWMRSVRDAIGDRRDTVVLFELPDVRRVLAEGAFWDIYYEHCSYFSAGSLARLFRRTGFDVLNVWPAYDDQYLIIEARPSAGESTPEPLPIENDVADISSAATSYAAQYADMVDEWRSRLRANSDAGGSAVIWGSGSKGVAFLAALGADADLIGAAVDINPFKHDRFMAGSGHRIIAPKELTEIRPSLVIAMNPAYRDEIGQDLASLGVTTTLDVV